MKVIETFKWRCPNCHKEQTETIIETYGPFITCTCEQCGEGFDQDTVKNSIKIEQVDD